MVLNSCRYLSSLLFPAALAVAAEQPTKTLRFEIPIRRESEMAQGITDAFSSVLKKQGYTLVVEDFPTKRGVEELKKGRIDGTLGRFGDISKLHGAQGYVRIDFPVVYLTYSLWCEKNPKLFDKKKPIRVGYHRGAMSIARFMETIEHKQVELQDMVDYRVALSMLKRQRLECIVGPGAYMEAEFDVSRELAGFYQHNLMTLRAFAWIKESLVPLKKNLETGLAEYPFPQSWLKKYHTDAAMCGNRFEVLCPDGVLFTKEIDLDKQPGP